MINKNDDASKLLELFFSVRNIYRNCKKMLLSCDPIMNDEKGFQCFDWWAVYVDQNINQSDSWLPNWVIRQYYPVKSTVEDESLTEILTIGAIPWRKELPESFIPMCFASRLLATSTPNSIYFASVIHMYESKSQLDGVVKVLDNSSDLLDENKKSTFNELIHTGKLLSIAVPLLEITSTSEFFDRVVDPLLDHPWPINQV